jgi:hypothetical protein
MTARRPGIAEAARASTNTAVGPRIMTNGSKELT